MKIREILFLSYNSILEGRSKSVFTVIATGVGVGTIVFMMSFGYGIEKMIKTQVSSPSSLRVITVDVNGTKNDFITEKAIESVKVIPNVQRVGVGQIVPASVTFDGNTANTSMEIYDDKYLKLADIKDGGNAPIVDLGYDEVAISTGLLDSLKTGPNDALGQSVTTEVISSQDESVSTDTKEATTKKIRYVIDNDIPFVVASDKQVVTGEAPNTLKVEVTKAEYINQTREKIEKLGLNTTYLGDTLNKITTLFNVFRYVLLTLGLIITAIAVLGAFNTLTISLMRRTQEIGILKIHGAQRLDIARLFLSESLLISLFGSFLGLVLGIAASTLANAAFNYFAVENGAKSIELFYLPPAFVVYLMVGTFVVGLMVGIYPAIRATRISILDAIKYE